MQTPNMQMVCHLHKCIDDFGPMQAFWLFAFERFTGLIERMLSNKQTVKSQFMKHFLCDIKFLSLLLPSDLSEEFSLHIEKLNPSSSGSLLETELAYPISLHSSDVPKCTHSKHIKLPDQFVISSFESDMLIEVLSLYRKTYSFMDGNFKLPSCFRRYNTINVMSRVYYSTKHDSKLVSHSRCK